MKPQMLTICHEAGIEHQRSDPVRRLQVTVHKQVRS